MEKLRIAIADDNERMVEVLSALIQGENSMELAGTAANGEEALDLIRRHIPDVVLLDLIMPKVDGLGVMEKLREDKIHPENARDYRTLRNRTGERYRRCLCSGSKLLYYEALQP